MPKPAKSIPRWLATDLLILVVGAVIIALSSLWLGINIHHMAMPPG